MFTYSIKKANASFEVPFESYSDAVRAAILEAGLGRILNDLVAGAKTEAESFAAVQKKLDAWARGEVRSAVTREHDPIRKRALELAEAAITRSKAFVAACQKAGVKVTHKDAQAKARELAKAQIAVEGNAFMAQAKIDVEAAKGLGDLDLGELSL